MTFKQENVATEGVGTKQRPKTQKWRLRRNRFEITYKRLDQSRNKEQQDLWLSMNLTRVFFLYITLQK